MLAVLLWNQMALKRRRAYKYQQTVQDSNRKPLQKACCRTCLKTDDLVSIFHNKEMEQHRTQDLRLVTGLEIKMNDGLSQMICTGCLEIVNTALDFRRTSRKAQKTLLGMNSKKPKVKKKSVPTVLKSRTKKKVEKLKEDFFSDNNYDDDFQMNHDYPVKAEDGVAVPVAKKLTKPSTAKRKRVTIPNASSYKCNTCNKEFRMKATYKAHMRFHTNYCVCESCGKRCRNNNQLQEHKRARHGLGRIHKCAYCEYSSATKEALTIHERRHTGERPYICDHCGATFHRRSNLVQHIAIHLPEKNFQCDMCPKKLKSRKFLQIHKHNAHTGRRYAYLCAVCGHRFEKPNKCTICHKREKSRKRLQVHVSKSHRERKYRYICPLCPKTYCKCDHVRRHLVRHHSLPRNCQGPIEKFPIENIQT